MIRKNNIFRKAGVFIITIFLVVSVFIPIVSSQDDTMNIIIEDRQQTNNIVSSLKYLFSNLFDNIFNLFFSDRINKEIGGNEFISLGMIDPWWNTERGYRKPINISHEKVDDDFINFPVLISITTDTQLADDTSDNSNMSTGHSFTITTVDYDDIIFNSSFEAGNLKNATYQNGDATGNRYYTAEVNYSTTTFPDKHWWFHYSMENTTGKKITIELISLCSEDFNDTSGDLPRWPDIEPVYSYNNADWERIPLDNVSWNETALNFTITIQPTQDKIWLAPIPPYTVSMRDDLFDTYSSSPYLDISSLGITPLGFNLTMATITDTTIEEENKSKVYVIAQQHAFETPSSFVADGMIRFLLNETNGTAASIRENITFRFVPIVNVEGVYYGISRYTPFRSGIQYDMNRAWNKDLTTMLNTCPEVRWVYNDMQTWQPDVFIDMHSEVNGESASADSEDCFFIHDGLYDDPLIRLCDNISKGYDGNQDYWPETGARGATGSTMAAVNARTRLGIHPSTSMEHPHDNRVSTTQHPTTHNPQTTDDWKDWGRKTVLGLNDYFKYVEPVLEQEYRVPLNTSWNIIALPLNETIHKTNITIAYNNTDYTWDDAVTESIILGFIYGYNRNTHAYETTDEFQPGFGYWIYSYENCELVKTGSINEDILITDLLTGWGIMGIPYNMTIPKENLTITYSGTDYNWTEATTGLDPIILGFIYTWDTDAQYYALSDTFEPGKGYWMYAYYNCTIKR